jgi:PIN domain nuclease of toxin-antitoxin system
MNLLLDTDVLVWVLAAPKKLSATAEEAIRSTENRVFVSVASAWQLDIHRRSGRSDTPDDLELQIVTKGFDPLPVKMSHAQAVHLLPDLQGDPFDRMLVAQAQVEGLTLVTSDRTVRRYPVATLPAI